MRVFEGLRQAICITSSEVKRPPVEAVGTKIGWPLTMHPVCTRAAASAIPSKISREIGTAIVACYGDLTERMSGESLDYSIERQRHSGFVGRDVVLKALDQLLVGGCTDRWVAVTGGPGMGKSAILAAWLARREAAGAFVPHHFIRRGHYGWDEPATIVRSLAAQVEARYPAQRDPNARPESRLVDLLTRVSVRELASQGNHLVLIIDGLDEYDAPAGAYDPLAAFLPHTLPRGVRLLCASRPRHPYLDALAARDGELTRIDLDDPAAADDNKATVHAFWALAATALELDERFVEEAVASANGNLQHAAMLRKHLAGVPPAEQRVEAIPTGLKSLLTMLWRRLASDAVAVCGLGILCAARKPLSLDELCAVAGWEGVTQRHAFVTSSRELLIETRREDGSAEYQLHHDSIRTHLVEQIGPSAVSSHHTALVRTLAQWPTPPDANARRYALCHALAHRAEVGDWAALANVACDLTFLEAKCCELGLHDVEADVARAAERCRAHGDAATARDLNDLSRALARESHWLRDEPRVLAGQLWNRLRRTGWSAADLDRRIRLPTDGAPFLRVRHAVSRESPALVRDLVGHRGAVNACAVTPDGRRVLSASSDTTLKVWNLDTGRIITTLEGHTRPVLGCAVAPDAQRAVSASSDNTLKVWNLDTGRIITTLEGHTGPVLSCAVAPDGRHVVSTSDDKTVRVWDLNTGRTIRTLENQMYAGMMPDVPRAALGSRNDPLKIWSIVRRGEATINAITADGRHAFSVTREKSLQIWSIDSNRVIATLEGKASGISACAVTPDGRHAILASSDNTLKVWEIKTGRVSSILEGHAQQVNGCSLSPDGRYVVSASRDRTLKVWDLDTGQIISTLEGHTDWVNACSITPDSRRVISASEDNTLKIWMIGTHRSVVIFESHAASIRSCAITPDCQHAVSASEDKTLKIWNAYTGRVEATLTGHADWVRSCAISHDGRRVVSASGDKTLRIWDVDSGRTIITLKGHADWVMSCAMTPDGRRVISASDDKTLRVWDVDTGHIVMRLEGHTESVICCAVTPDGQCAISASMDKMVKVWDMASGRIISNFEGHTAPVNGLAVFPDCRHIVSASGDKMLKVWEINTGCLVATLEGHTAGVRSCAVTPDGRRVVSASPDKTIRVWDLETCECILTHRGDAAFTSVAVTGKMICAGDSAGTLWILDWPPPPSPVSQVSSPTPDIFHSNGTRKRVRTPRSRRSRNLILFLAANPNTSTPLSLDQECAAIERELRMTTNRDDFEFCSKWAVTVDDMARHMMELQPAIIHFSGHGARVDSVLAHSPTTYRDICAEEMGGSKSGIYLQSDQDGAQLVTARALAMMVRSSATSARILVLNACYSDTQADELCTAVDCVVGMAGAIHEDAARSFAAGFYRALGNHRSVGNAIDHAVAILAAKRLSAEHLPRCRTRDGIDANQIILGTSHR